MGIKAGETWYRTFFSGAALDFWRAAMTPEITGHEANFLEKALRLPTGGRVLDAPCGNGRLAIELARRGYRPSGVDLAEPFLEEARQAAETAGVDVTWRLADMRELPGSGDFDAAYCFGNSFGYFDHAGTRRLLAGFAGALRPGGRLALDTAMAAESILPNLESQLWMKVGDVMMFVANEYDVATGRLETEYSFLQDGRMETGLTSHAVYTVSELGRLLDEAGLDVVDHWSSIEFEPYTVGNPRLILIAQRR